MYKLSMIPEQCRAARGLLGWSQERLAEEAQVSRQTVVDFERGARNPTRKSLETMRKALEGARVDFVAHDNIGPGVRLRQSVWKLKPIDSESVNWLASSYCGDLVVRAPSERCARLIASRALVRMTKRERVGEPVIVDPWNFFVGETSCEETHDPKYDVEGPDAILEPDWINPPNTMEYFSQV